MLPILEPERQYIKSVEDFFLESTVFQITNKL